MRKSFITFCLSLALMPASLVPTATAQERRDKEQTYVLETPYEVEKIAQPASKHVKNVILMIGDGMSLMHVYSAWTANRGKLWLENCPVTGLSKTYCANRLITDSGAGGTALATGHKTNYHMVGVDPSGKPLESLATLANKKGLSSGIAVTCRLWDATPADFCCHNVDRDNEAEIVADYVTCGVDYVFGGGAKLFENRTDGRDSRTDSFHGRIRLVPLSRHAGDVEKLRARIQDERGKTMSVIKTTDKNGVIAVAQDGTPATGAMIDEWCASWDAGRLPDGYSVEGPTQVGRPPLHGERMSSITVRITHAQKDALEREARRAGISMSAYVRDVLSARTA